MRYLRYVGILALLWGSPALAQDNPAATADLDRIMVMADGGNTTAALEALDTLLIDDPDNIEALYMQGLLKLQADDLDGAEQAFRNILTLNRDLAEVWNNLAMVLAQKGEYSSARQQLERAVTLDPNFADAQANLGDLYVRQALDAYRNAASTYQSSDSEAARANASKLEFLDQMFDKR